MTPVAAVSIAHIGVTLPYLDRGIDGIGLSHENYDSA